MYAGRDEVYIGGPMRGRPMFGFDVFDAVAAHCRNVKRWRTWNPADHDRETWPEIETWPGFAAGDVDQCPAFDLAEAMRWDLVKVAQSEHLVLLPGWEESSGARHERYVAEVTGSAIWLASRSVIPGEWYLDPDPVQIRVTSPTRGVDSHPVYSRHEGGVVYYTTPEAWPNTVSSEPIYSPDEALAAQWVKQHGQFITKDSGQRTEFASGMVRDTDDGKPRYDLIPILPLRRLAELYARGATKYQARNWEQANSAEELERFKASFLRHAYQALDGARDEDHWSGAAFNLFAIVWLEDKLNTSA